ncbi:hypothetical protein HY484_02880 [Candidatus Woesearchaeota archaeon]|nr:hypothetical protein [Candidatus Woesearchaeota archaeon]
MATTIQVHDDTLEMLKKMRHQTKTASYDETIHEIIKKATSKKESLYGFLGKSSIKQILKGLRDENDRL